MSRASITSNVRNLLGDQASSFMDSAQGDGETTRFDLSVENIDPTGFNAAIVNNGVTTILNPGVDYEMDFSLGTITLTNPLAEAATLITSGTSYREFEPSEVDSLIDMAWAMYTKGRAPKIYLDPDPNAVPVQQPLPPEEEWVFTLAVTIQSLYALLGDAAQDVDISTPDGVQIPRGQYFQQILTLIQKYEQEYREKAALLNVGLERIEMFNLRRVSRTTNRLVPEYVDREFDNRLYPQRILPPIDAGITSGLGVETSIGSGIVTQLGNWSSTLQYHVNDEVFWKGATYLAVADNIDVDPLVDVTAGDGTNGKHWAVTNIGVGYYP